MERNRILVTGATGALGREILPRLLRRNPRAGIDLLIRPRENEPAEDRVRHVLRYVLTYWPELDPRRVTALAGDVTWPRLGLDPARYEDLRRSVTHIVHCAAAISLDPPLAAARRVNRGGTREVLRLAGSAPRLRRLAHLSTAFVAGRRTGRIAETDLDDRYGFVNAYERSKYEAERLVRGGMDRVPITVFRPSIVVGDSRDGHTCAFGSFYHPLQLIADGRVRDVPGRDDLRLDLVPVDYVAEAVSLLLDDPRAAGRTVHLVAGWERSLPLRRLLEMAIRITGGPARPPLTFTGSGRRLPRRADPHRTAPFFTYLAGEKRFETDATRARLGDLARRTDHPETFVARCLDFCRDTGWGRRLPWEDQSCRIASAC